MKVPQYYNEKLSKFWGDRSAFLIRISCLLHQVLDAIYFKQFQQNLKLLIKYFYLLLFLV